jgi:hypothetical protein
MNRLHGRHERDESRSEPHRVGWGQTGRQDGEVVGRDSVSHRMPCLLPVDRFSLIIFRAPAASPSRKNPAYGLVQHPRASNGICCRVLNRFVNIVHVLFAQVQLLYGARRDAL